MDQLTVLNPGELYRQATDVAGVCRDIVLKKAIEIQGRRYVPVEPWMAIAVAHGCIASVKSVEWVEPTDKTAGGFLSVAMLRRQSDGEELATAQGFVGEDETTWFGGETEVWNKATRKYEKKTKPKRPDYAIRAMAQTRSISRVCRSAFAHVVVLIDSQLETVPAEEIEHDENLHGAEVVATPAESTPPPREDGRGERQEAGKRWQQHKCSYGTKGGPLRGKLLGELDDRNLKFLWDKFCGAGAKTSKPNEYDLDMIDGLKLWKAELLSNAAGGHVAADDDEIPF